MCSTCTCSASSYLTPTCFPPASWSFWNIPSFLSVHRLFVPGVTCPQLILGWYLPSLRSQPSLTPPVGRAALILWPVLVSFHLQLPAFCNSHVPATLFTVSLLSQLEVREDGDQGHLVHSWVSHLHQPLPEPRSGSSPLGGGSVSATGLSTPRGQSQSVAQSRWEQDRCLINICCLIEGHHSPGVACLEPGM